MSKPMFAQPKAKGRVEIADKYGDVICKASGEYERDSILKCIVNHDRMAGEIAELRDKHSKISNEIAELCEALGAVNEIALLIASDIYEDSLLHDNVKLLMDIHK